MLALEVMLRFGQVMPLLSLAFLATTLLLAGILHAERASALLAVQGLTLAIAALAVAIQYPRWDSYFAVLVVALVDVLALPLLLTYLAKPAIPVALQSRPAQALHGTTRLGARPAVSVALGLMLASYGLVRAVAVPGTLISGSYLPTVVASMMGGLAVVRMQHHPLLQAAGLLVLGNGVQLLGLGTNDGLAPATIMGIVFNLLVVATLLLVRSFGHEAGS